MKNEAYLAPSCEITELESRESVLNTVSGSNESYSTRYQYDDPFDDED